MPGSPELDGEEKRFYSELLTLSSHFRLIGSIWRDGRKDSAQKTNQPGFQSLWFP